MTDEQSQRRMFGGITVPEMEKSFREALVIMGPSMLAMSILSDAQEVLAQGQSETCRQFINRAKWVIAECLSDRMTVMPPPLPTIGAPRKPQPHWRPDGGP